MLVAVYFSYSAVSDDRAGAGRVDVANPGQRFIYFQF
jgi:hypothetical protein